ncbi:MAG: PQQ-binding-like beta-propeller repeat protein [Sphingomicrobium sp.]
MNRTLKTITAAMIAASLVSGCSLIGKGKKPTPTVGDRVSVLVNELEMTVDDETAALPMVLPPAVANADWGQSGGNPSKSIGQVALGTSLGQAWTASVGQGTGKAQRLGGGPVVANGKLFTIDTTSTVRAFDAATGQALWSVQFGTEKGNNASLFGGGVAADASRVYATNGLGHVAALDAATGAIVWTVQPAGPLRGAPTLDGDTIYVMSQDNQIFSLKTADGKTNWSNAASLEIAGVFGTGSPAASRGTVVAGFSSGELNAYRYENGRMVWQDALSRTTISTGVASLSDIDADPVIEGNFAYALGQGGRMVALDLNSGQRVWEINMAGIATPWVAGDWIFAVNDKAQVVAVQRMTGKIRWISQLPQWRNGKKETGPIFYAGPVLAGGRLILANSEGGVFNVNPATGDIQTTTRVDSGVRFQPVVASGMLYLLSDAGRITAFR